MIRIQPRGVTLSDWHAQEVKLTGIHSDPTIVWLRQDLRLHDHPAIAAADQRGGDVICVYVLEDVQAFRDRGGASNWWLDKSLKSLRSSISERGGKLICRKGDPQQEIPALAHEVGAAAVMWGRRYGKAEREVDGRIKASLKEKGIEALSFNTSLLTEPWELETSTGSYYRVFTPYWKALRSYYSLPDVLPAPGRLSGQGIEGDQIEDWGLHPTKPDWSTGFNSHWEPGENGARDRLARFLEDDLSNYTEMRNWPDRTGTSGLSPHLRFGEISPVQVWRGVQARLANSLQSEDGAWTFLSEIAWREFSYVLFFHNPEMSWKNYNDKFDSMPWHRDSQALAAWQSGQTGYPIVDAGMRQLWETGWMHNRVRMIVASFLTKHLLIHWKDGEDWFWDTLVDADPASNAAGWQWTAGSGADASPYFRIFNPITQGQKFDKSGDYVRRWCPELAELPTKALHSPWSADKPTLKRAGVELGETYPRPIIEHSEGRARALGAWDELKNKQDAA